MLLSTMLWDPPHDAQNLARVETKPPSDLILLPEELTPKQYASMHSVEAGRRHRQFTHLQDMDAFISSKGIVLKRKSFSRLGKPLQILCFKPLLVMRSTRFRPCIDIHNGLVKQIVGGTLTSSEAPVTNFETDESPAFYSSMYARDNLPGGHIIMLGPGNESAARTALSAFPGGMQVGGGIQPANASRFLNAGASHVIVTSYVFREGIIVWERVEDMVRAIGKQRLVLDVSCRKRDGEYYVCTDRWQKWTDFALNARNFERLGSRCDEILVHAVDVEGKKSGIDTDLVACLAEWATVPVTYAGGVRNLADLDVIKHLGRGLVDFTVGSALDIFGGPLKYKNAVEWQRQQESVLR